MTNAQPLWISPQAYERLRRELATLRGRYINASADRFDREEDTTAVQHAWQARIRQIHDVLVNAVVGDDPPDDGVAEPGMVLTVRYDTGEAETFLLGTRGAEYSEMEVYSVQSPLGAAIAGARPGERRTYTLPSGASVSVTLLEAVPYGVFSSPA